MDINYYFKLNKYFSHSLRRITTKMLIAQEKINFEPEHILEGYESQILSILHHYAKDAEHVACVEFGRGNGKLVPWFNTFIAGDAVALEDFEQTIFQGDKTLYEDVNVVEWNAFGGTALDTKFDVIYCSLPNQIPGLEETMFQERLNSAFSHLKSMLNKDGVLITVDFNTLSIQRAVMSAPVMKTKPYIQTYVDELSPMYYICVLQNG